MKCGVDRFSADFAAHAEYLRLPRLTETFSTSPEEYHEAMSCMYAILGAPHSPPSPDPQEYSFEGVPSHCEGEADEDFIATKEEPADPDPADTLPDEAMPESETCDATAPDGQDAIPADEPPFDWTEADGLDASVAPPEIDMPECEE